MTVESVTLWEWLSSPAGHLNTELSALVQRNRNLRLSLSVVVYWYPRTQ